MAYSADISRLTPGCFLFVVDQSGSMDESIAGGETKARFVADVLNRTLVNLIVRCTREDGVRDYFDVGVLGYNSSKLGSSYVGALSNSVFHKISAVEANPLRVEDRAKKTSDGAGGVTEQTIKFPVWFEPTNTGGTPMTAALTKAAQELVAWCDAHPQSYPPTVIHVTDGQSTDGDPSNVADAIRQISTNDGQVLLCNLHVDTAENQSNVFPSSAASLPDQYAKLLFSMSSIIPAHLHTAANEKGYPCGPESRFFSYRADIGVIVDFFDIGTRASNLR